MTYLTKKHLVKLLFVKFGVLFLNKKTFKIVELVHELELELLKLDCNLTDFINKEDTSSDIIINSQSVLLACGWFISTQDLMGMFISKLNFSFDDEYFKENILNVIIFR